ncbi:Transposase DDE domain protein [Planctomycetes bacterium CA13]|uniref:Transposase DDE domain protein n=2 Tax=Novipirellula herctigrandis TaxID=2527986 RepID=A0A5C5YXJ8_9BACT|nr:Transposase DDE domain protein [Planctomycetes bacterium CA13]TWT76301.1 Transposase DDE domain protein [Planctomycetes bacterium CA13]TWT78677.1 Transposase DDE domain protein [Planctomycetes bacterium CA13]TWT79765.1 Transposase DDE domain protein [Planctomycetes bacterium CA13]TWT80132.1 Transposase DDE domain protein [Planctomycetes bacterium CA13]
MIRPSTTKLELAEKQQAVSCGGIAVILELIKKLGLRKELNRSAKVFKLHLPYDETDHILNIALNLLAGGTCLDHIEQRRNDEAYLDALGAERIPDPTTAGDFCRRFSHLKLLMVMQAVNRVRQTVWKQQEDSFLDCATIEADGTMVETSGEKKSGIGINYKGQWGYHPLVVTLAETQELLYLHNRSGNRTSEEDSAFFYDLAIQQCTQAGFRKIVLRGDTAFSSTEHLDRWDNSGVKFILGYSAHRNLCRIADSLAKTAWKRLDRSRRSTPDKAERACRPNERERIVQTNGYKNQRLTGESYAEFEYCPTACEKTYRMIVVRKDIDVTSGQQLLFSEERYFFYITNETAGTLPAREVIRGSNQRCDQENTISQLKACGALTAPLDNLESNMAYMLFASLAWTLKIWSGLLVQVKGNESQKRVRREARNRIIRMEFWTYLNSLILLPAQIIRSSRQRVFRLLTYRPTVDLLMTLHDHIRKPLRC